jgi:hypothetical protein
MNCGDLEQALIRGPAVAKLPLDVRDHLRNCQACLKIVQALSAPVVSGEPSSATLNLIEQKLVADFEAVRPVMPGPPRSGLRSDICFHCPFLASTAWAPSHLHS